MVCICLLLLSSLGFSQNQLGLSAVYGTEIETLGGGLRGEIVVDENFSFVPEIIAFLPKTQNINVGNDMIARTKTNMILFNADIHYTFDFYIKNTAIYALTGFNYTEANRDLKNQDQEVLEFEEFKDSEVGANVGLGVRYSISNNFYLFAESKYIISKLDQTILSIGVLTNF